MTDVRFALRTLLASPGTTVAVLIMLGLGIGLNTTMFGALYTVVLRPLPYAASERLVMLWQHDDEQPAGLVNVSHPNFVDLQTSLTSYDALGAFSYQEFTVDHEGAPQRITGLRVSAGLLEGLGRQPAHGRHLVPTDEDSRGVMISDRLWRSLFAASSDLPGGEVTLDGERHTVVGIMPPDFSFPPSFTSVADGVSRTVAAADLWVPMGTSGIAGRRELRTLFVLGRLRADAAITSARAEASVLATRLATAYPDANRGLGLRVVSLHDQVSGAVRAAMVAVFAAVSFVTLLVCASIANLLLMRATRRKREMTIRVALGATRARLVRQLLAEGTWMAAGGGLLGIVVARWGLDLVALLGSPAIPRLGDVALYRHVVGFAVGTSLLSGMVFSLAPAWRAASVSPNAVLRGEGPGVTATSATRLAQRSLAAAQLAVCVILMVGAGLMFRTFVALTRVDPGFDPARVLTAQLFVAPTLARAVPERVALADRLLARLASLPGVEAVGLVSNAPLSTRGENTVVVAVEARGELASGDGIHARRRPASPDYFRTMGIPIRRGRPFLPSDGMDAPRVAIANETFAALAWPGADPLGQRVMPAGADDWHVVVGVATDVRHDGIASPPQPELYAPYAQEPGRSFTVVIRTAGDPLVLGTALRAAAREVHRQLPVSQLQAMDAAVMSAMATPRLTTTLLLAFAGLGMLVAVLGVYATVSQSVVHRTRELGIRLSLGAARANIVRLVLGQELPLLVTGVLAGMVGALALTRLMGGLLYGVSPSDTATITVVPALLIAVAVVACLVPARRATRIDPLVAVRAE
jgi:putative ABC transport system permease protein